jgi:hypothetical protein
VTTVFIKFATAELKDLLPMLIKPGRIANRRGIGNVMNE